MVSADLLHWQHLPVALAPDKAYDCDGVFSVSATIFHNTSSGITSPVLTYSVQCEEALVHAVPADIS